VIATREPGTTQAVDFGVHKLIVLLYSSVSAPSYDLVVLDQNGADGNSVFQESLKRFIYCRLHEDVHIGSQFVIFFYLYQIHIEILPFQAEKPIVLTSQAAPRMPDAG
jgi:hypothetical protein